jgi:hypothetical protein
MISNCLILEMHSFLSKKNVKIIYTTKKNKKNFIFLI